MKTKHHWLVVWKDVQNRNTDPLFLELFDHRTEAVEEKKLDATMLILWKNESRFASSC